MQMNFVGYLDKFRVIPLKREDALQCALTAFKNDVHQNLQIEARDWNPSDVIVEPRGFQKINCRGQGGVYVYAGPLWPNNSSQILVTTKVPSRYTVIKVIGMALPDEECKEGLYNRFRQRESTGKPSLWQWIHIVPIERDHSFLIRKLEKFLLDRFRTTDNSNDARLNVHFSPMAFDDFSEPMQREELEVHSRHCSRSLHIHWFQHGKWPEIRTARENP